MIQDWVEGRCLSKALLNCVSGGRDDEAGFSIYHRYMNEASLIDVDVSFSGLSRFGRLDRRIIADLQYKLHDPQAEPAHWTIFSKDDVARLGNLYKLRFVIYAYTPLASETIPARVPDNYWLNKCAANEGRLALVHDFRGVEQRRPGELFGVVLTTRTPHRLFKVSSGQLELLDAHTHVGFARQPGPPRDAAVNVADCNNDYLEAVYRLLQRPLDERERGSVPTFSSMRQIVECNRHQLFHHLGQPVMLCHFSRQLGRSFMSGRPAAATRQLFTTLAIATELSEPDCFDDFADHATPDTTVIAVYAERYLCLVNEATRLEILMHHLDTKGLAEKLSNRSDLSGVRKRLPREIVVEAKRSRVAKMKRSFTRRLPQICKCFVCTTPQYRSNMAPSGPERLCTVPYSASDLLDMLGALDDKAKGLLKRVVDLSIAAMDIESSTLDVDLAGPHPGERVQFEEFGGPVLSGYIYKTQRPIMIGHTDTLSRERGETWFDLVKDDTPKAVYDMMARYWLHVTKLQRKARDEKTRLCSELLELVNLYKSAFLKFSEEWLEASRIQRDYMLASRKNTLARLLEEEAVGDDEYRHLVEEAEDKFLKSDDWKMATLTELVTAFRSTIPGLLESKLAKLRHRYVVFNFYG